MELSLGLSRVTLLRFTLVQSRMELCTGISRVARLCPGAGSISQSVCFSSTSQIWQQGKDFKRLSLISRVRPNSRFGSSRQLQQAAAVERGTSAINGSSSAEDVIDTGEISEEHFVDRVPVGPRGAPSRSAPSQRNDAKFGRRFPGQKQVNEDVTVPAEALRQGALFKGTVSSVQRFGAFVKFGAFADGLIHISKLGAGYVRDINEVVKVGQEVTVRIVNVEHATGRISLALVDEHETDVRKPYVSPGREEGSQIGDRPRFDSGSSGRFSPPMVERVSRGSHGSTSISTEYRQRKESPQYQAGSVGNSQQMAEEVQEIVSSSPDASYSRMDAARNERETSDHKLESGGIFDKELDSVSRIPDASSRPQREARRAGEEPRFQPGSGRRSPVIGKEEEKNGGNPPTSTGLGKARQEGKTPTSPRQREAREEDRFPRNNKSPPFTQWESPEAQRILRDIFGETGPWDTGEAGKSPHIKQGNQGNLSSGGGDTSAGGGTEGEEDKMKQKMKLVQIEDMEDGY